MSVVRTTDVRRAKTALLFIISYQYLGMYCDDQRGSTSELVRGEEKANKKHDRRKNFVFHERSISCQSSFAMLT
jgi:hypothetical protein